MFDSTHRLGTTSILDRMREIIVQRSAPRSARRRATKSVRFQNNGSPGAKKTGRKKNEEITLLGSVLRNIGGIGGSFAGNLLGNGALGRSAGTKLGAAVSRWIGSGDYSVRSNSLVQNFTGSGDIPMMHKTGQDAVIRHREYLGEIVGSVGFSAQSFPLNPGLSTTFPWLAAVAQQYQEYTFKGVIFEFVSTCGSAIASTNNALGTVMMATNYRCTDPAFTSKMAINNEFFSSDSKPSESFCHPIECDPKENPFNVQYVRGGAAPTGEDLKTYDLGLVTVATEGMQAAVTVGELWVSYEVELRKPCLAASMGKYIPAAHYYSTTGVDNTHPCGTAALTTLHDTLGGAFGPASDPVTFTFPARTIGTFQVTVSWDAATACDMTANQIQCTNCTRYFWSHGSSLYYLNSECTAGGSQQSILTSFINVPDSTLTATFTIGDLVTLTGATGVDIAIVQVKQGMY